MNIAILDFIAAYTQERGYPPSNAEIAEACNMPPSTVSWHVAALVGLGKLKRAQRYRGLRIT